MSSPFMIGDLIELEEDTKMLDFDDIYGSVISVINQNSSWQYFPIPTLSLFSLYNRFDLLIYILENLE